MFHPEFLFPAPFPEFAAQTDGGEDTNGKYDPSSCQVQLSLMNLHFSG